MNWILINRDKLSLNNYVRKADAKTNYWLDFSDSKLRYYNNRTQGSFNIIIFGDENIETDFYVIPYQDIRHLLTIEALSKSKGRKRWIGNIIGHHISLTNTGAKLNIAHLYSIYPGPTTDFSPITVEDSNDYAIENAKREVQIRIKQSVFRKTVLENFGLKCCLTGVTEKDLLIASHIVPWSVKLDSRLSPHNGLCLCSLYDSLFDKGYFSLAASYKVIVTPKLPYLSADIRQWLTIIEGRRITPPIKFEISQAALEYHRANIFKT